MPAADSDGETRTRGSNAVKRGVNEECIGGVRFADRFGGAGGGRGIPDQELRV